MELEDVMAAACGAYGIMFESVRREGSGQQDAKSAACFCNWVRKSLSCCSAKVSNFCSFGLMSVPFLLSSALLLAVPRPVIGIVLLSALYIMSTFCWDCPSCKGNVSVFMVRRYRTFSDKRVPVQSKTRVPCALLAQHSEQIPNMDTSSVLAPLLGKPASNKPAVTLR